MSDISKASLPKAIFLMGPTASGKTALAIELRKILPVELISVDSALIYKGMDIGTAKPNAEELLAAPHRLLNIRDPSQAYSAADFRRDALAESLCFRALLICAAMRGRKWPISPRRGGSHC